MTQHLDDFHNLDEARTALADVLDRIPDSLLPELREDDKVLWHGGLGFPIGGTDTPPHVEWQLDDLIAALAADRETARRAEVTR